jgi:PAS domain S-box-containing protein
MNLRSKLLLGIGIALIITFTLVAVFSYLSLDQSYRTLENQEVQRAMESRVSSLNNDMKNTHSINSEYATRSETYQFAEGKNQAWIDANTDNDFFTRFDIDYVLLFNPSNQLVFGKGYNSSSLRIEPVPLSLVNDMRDLNIAENIFTSTKGKYGVFNCPSGLFIISSHPVINDTFKESTAGSLQIVRRIDNQYLADLADQAGFTVTLIPSQEIAGNQALASIVSRITPHSPIVIEPESDDIIAGYVHIKDLRNPGGFYVKVTERRTIYHAGRESIVIFLASLTGAGIFFILFVLLFVDRIVLSRLNSIISTVKKNKETGNNNSANADSKDDELAQLALEIDPVFSELAASRIELKESEERYRTLIDKLPDYVTVHRDGILLYANPAAASNLGYDAATRIGKSFLPFIAPEYHDTVRKAIAQRVAGEEFPSYEIKIVASDGTCRTVLVNGATIQYEGKPASLNVLTDITTVKQAEEAIRRTNEELEKRVAERTEDLSKTNVQLTAEILARTRAEQEISRSLEEKDLLLREIHHRVKNNLQIIASLLNLQARYIADPKVLESIKESQSRVRAMALVHERIYRSHNISEINLKEYLNYLTKQIFSFYNIPQYQIGITVTMDDIMTNIDTVIPIGLIMNELVSNSLKHGFPEGRKGTVSIECTPQGADMLRFVYHDNGIGMPAGFDWKNAESLGLRLVNSLVDQLNGTIVLGTGEGTTFIIEIQKTPSGKIE